MFLRSGSLIGICNRVVEIDTAPLKATESNDIRYNLELLSILFCTHCLFCIFRADIRSMDLMSISVWKQCLSSGPNAWF